MTIYKNLDGDSGIESYQIYPESIIVKFNDGKSYEYTYISAGRDNVETMKKRAIQGEGLNGFINTYVKYNYSKKN